MKIITQIKYPLTPLIVNAKEPQLMEYYTISLLIPKIRTEKGWEYIEHNKGYVKSQMIY